MFANYIYLIYVNKSHLELNKLQWLICHQTKPLKYLVDSSLLNLIDQIRTNVFSANIL